MTTILERKDLIDFEQKFEEVTSKSFTIPVVKEASRSDQIFFIDGDKVHVFKCLTVLGKAGVYSFEDFYDTFFKPFFNNRENNSNERTKKSSITKE